MQINEIKVLIDRVIKEYPQYGSVELKFIFHAGNLEFHEFSKTDKTLVKKEAK
jgi:hypothetical protein